MNEVQPVLATMASDVKIVPSGQFDILLCADMDGITDTGTLRNRLRAHRPIMVYALEMFTVLLLAGCSVPSKVHISQDFKQLFIREAVIGVQAIVMSVEPGEGDADNVYQHIRFDVLVEEDVIPKTGWFAGMSLRRGQRLYGGEVVVLYQKNNESEWVVARQNLTRAPTQSP